MLRYWGEKTVQVRKKRTRKSKKKSDNYKKSCSLKCHVGKISKALGCDRKSFLMVTNNNADGLLTQLVASSTTWILLSKFNIGKARAQNR